jgi:general secretion pathway protein K
MEINQKGSVLVFVLIFIAFAASTVLVIHEDSMENMGAVSDDFYENQSHIYAMTAMTAVKESLIEDDNEYDSKKDDWALVPMVEVPYGYISISITPANKKISLNNLISTDKKVADKHMEVCKEIFIEHEIDSITCGEIKDYIDSDSDFSVDGAESKIYEFNGVEFRTKNAPFDSLAELKVIMQDDEQFSKIKDYFTVYAPEKSININFASEDVIKFFLPEIEGYEEDIVDYTRDNEYKDVSNIQDAVNISREDYLKILQHISVKSSLFYVKTEVTLNDKPRYYHALIEKKGNKAEVVKFLAGLNGDYY